MEEPYIDKKPKKQKKKKKKMNFMFVIALLIILTVAVLIFLRLVDFRETEVLTYPVIERETVCREVKLEQPEKQGWREYTNEEFCISFLYPEHWQEPKESKTVGYSTSKEQAGREITYIPLQGQPWADAIDPNFQPVKERADDDITVWNLGRGEGGCSIAHLHMTDGETIISVLSSLSCTPINNRAGAVVNLEKAREDIHDFAESVIKL